MHTYKGWAVELVNGTFANDGKNDVTPALFQLKRQAADFRDDQKILGRVVKVNITVEVAK